MNALTIHLHPAMRPGRRLTLADSGQLLFSQQGNWDGGSTLHCAAMALALLGRLSDPVRIPHCADGPEASFWHHAWPRYLHGLTLSELAGFIWELNAGVEPVMVEGSSATVLRACVRELKHGWPVILGWRSRSPPEGHAALVVGVEGRRGARGFKPHALLLLDPAEAEPGLAAFNARLEFGRGARRQWLRYVTAAGTRSIVLEGGVSIRVPGRAVRTTVAGCA